MTSRQLAAIAPSQWQVPASWPALGTGEVHVWKASVADWATQEAQLRLFLDRDEVARAARFRFSRDRQQFTVSHGLLRCLLAHYSGGTPASLEFEHGPAGKPCLVLPTGAPRLQFNLAHSADVVLMAVTSGAHVGVDVERWLNHIEFEDLIERFFSRQERDEFRLLASDTRLAGFFACWSRKEAYIKATGFGVSLGLDYFDVTVAADQPARILADRRAQDGESRWQLLDLDVGPEYAGALVVEGSDCLASRYLLSPASDVVVQMLTAFRCSAA